MPTFLKVDDVLWLRHLERVGIAIPPGVGALFKVNDHEVDFAPMRPQPSGAPTKGLRAVGMGKPHWTAIPKSTNVDLELVRLAKGTAPESRSQVAGASALELEPVALPVGRRAAFDAYVMVDWSASRHPVTGADSVWWCVLSWQDGTLATLHVENPPTREEAFLAIREVLRDVVRQEKSVLVGFDLPYGYPGGFASALGLVGTPWRAVWSEIARRIHDDQLHGTNNRFGVAGDFNAQIGGSGGGPFWGRPSHFVVPHLSTTAPTYPVAGLARLRLTDARVRGPQPVWNLYGVGSVGSQALLGIPRVLALRDDPVLAPVSCVWPFETGPALPERCEGARIVHAEIYPSLVRLPALPPGTVKDRVQVLTIGRHFATKDTQATLAYLFTAPAVLPPGNLSSIVREEGWILGVT